MLAKRCHEKKGKINKEWKKRQCISGERNQIKPKSRPEKIWTLKFKKAEREETRPTHKPELSKYETFYKRKTVDKVNKVITCGVMMIMHVCLAERK